MIPTCTRTSKAPLVRYRGSHHLHRNSNLRCSIVLQVDYNSWTMVNDIIDDVVQFSHYIFPFENMLSASLVHTSQQSLA